ncbi:Lytic transglycosylase, catalytic [Sphingobium herbicidovorans NBRC 16415]|uniref:Lytic transglycosylase, catalytic n=1 Tax=Sphingobium herbicidovorans (strain ATCC 700291 / DSM 11019 / CCUG 56400 / KCTC 2939 / LMG 18315 / NBRC 16415 / MH) TaxID=1219045 RepID=A0A086PBN6_SPHHM|nr:lytic transglycosylase domain-containing protein [Sphingobium herbicidovorans]KFG90804.1 Lytic transglycosylase, catalytic [Sphingobium herbicidovorans NBRC 16415]
MNFKLAPVALIGALASTPTLARDSAGRTVQLITLTRSPPIDVRQPRSDPENENPFSPIFKPTIAPGAEAFRIHDLSRRWVEFQMASSISQPSERSVPTYAASSMTDRLAIPTWMRNGSSLPSMVVPSYTPGCNRLGYRPTGFLAPAAERRRQSYFALMSSIACEHGLPTGLFDAMIIQESRYNPLALSPKRAFGLAQLMPGTATMLGVNRFDVVDNLRGGARYLRSHLDQFRRYDLALAAYNAGPGSVRNGQVPAFRETRGYVANILDFWRRLSAPLPAQHLKLPRTAEAKFGRSATLSVF